MPTFRLLNSDGTPASLRQVIIKNPGFWDYAMSDIHGEVKLPNFVEFGDVVVGGQTIYQGTLKGTLYLP